MKLILMAVNTSLNLKITLKITKSIHIPRQHSSNQGSISYISMFKYDMGRFIFCYVFIRFQMMHEKGRINVRLSFFRDVTYR